LEALPTDVPSLLHYDDHELSQLQMPTLAAKAIAARATVLLEFERVSKHLKHPLPWQDWLWAVDIARSRTFELPSPDKLGVTLHGMFPVCDMLNHKFGSTSLRIDAARRAFEVTAGESFAAGDQVLISYGAMGNDELLEAYGFVDDENDVDSVDIPVAALATAARYGLATDGAAPEDGPPPQQPESEAEWAERLAFLRARHGARAYKIFRSGEEESLMEAARILCTDRLDFARMAAAPVPGADWAAPVDLGSECRAWAAVARACWGLLEGFPTTLEEDEALLSDAQERVEAAAEEAARAAAERRFTAVLYRALKKAVLQEGASRLEYYARTSMALGRVLQPTVVAIQS
jgi:hypothetical protein